MIGWLLKKVARQAAPKPTQPLRSVPGETCALWHDVARALDQSSRAAGRNKTKGVAR